MSRISYLNLFLLLILMTPFIKAQEVGAYTNKNSYYKGETVDVYISTSRAQFDMNIFRIEDTLKLITTYTGIAGAVQTTRDSSFHYGAGWNVTYSFTIPEDWQPGYYRGEFPIEGGRRGFTFIVKEVNHGSWSNILLVASTNTYQAYNPWGGKSLYNYNSSEGIKAYKVSFLRPFPSAFGSIDFYNYEHKFIKWSETNNIRMEIVSNFDVHSNPSIVDNYDLIFIVGHNEYWSLEERQAYENYYAQGGNIVILSGNTNWWQVRFEDDGNTLVCYKSSAEDPITGVDNQRVTTNWYRTPVNNPENKIIGLSFLYGGYVNTRGLYPDTLGYGDYNAVRTHHWIYEGTGLVDGDEFGFDSRIVGIEVDGAHFVWEKGLPVVTGIDQTPATFRILALSPAYTASLSGNMGFGTMGYFYNENGGVIFNSATTGWVDGLGNDPIVDRITFNVMDKFLANRFPPEITSWEPYEVLPAVFNNKESFLNKRNLLIPQGTETEFKITAENIHEGSINYFWMKNDEVIGNSSEITFVNDETNKNVITGFAYNQYDTSSISWNIFNVDFAIVSEPDTNLEINVKYFYRMEVFNMDGDEIFYELLAAPDWLQLDSNVLSGTPISFGSFEVSVRAFSTTKEDIQTFTLVVEEVTSVKDLLPLEYSVSQNYPNPFNPLTTIAYELPFTSTVSIKIFDIIGREVRTLVNAEQQPGSYSVTWDSITNEGAVSGSGIYFCIVKAGDYNRTLKMILLK